MPWYQLQVIRVQLQLGAYSSSHVHGLRGVLPSVLHTPISSRIRVWNLPRGGLASIGDSYTIPDISDAVCVPQSLKLFGEAEEGAHFS